MRSGSRGNALAIVLAALLGMPGSVAAQASDPEVRKGVKLTEDGEYDAAIVTLDAAVRRLAAAASPANEKDRAEAYLNLGIAYLAKGHETAARANFRDAIARARDLRLTSDKFSPRVIEVFEQARAEAAKGPTVAQAQAADSKKKGGKTGLVLIGVAAAAAAAAGVAVAGGGGSSASSSSTPTATSTPAPATRTETFTGVLDGQGQGDYRQYRIVPTGPGNVDATLTWTDRERVLEIRLLADGGAEIGKSTPVSNTSARLVVPVVNRVYIVEARQFGGGPEVSYTLTLTYPQ